MPKLSITNFSGGQNKMSPERLDTSEASTLQNLIHIEGNLQSIAGRNLYNQTEIIADTPVKSLYRFYRTGHRVNDTSATTKQGWTLARCGEYVWLACEQTSAVNTAAVDATTVTVTTAADTKTMPSSATVMVNPGDGTAPYRLAYTAKNESTGALTVSALATAIPASSTITVVDFRPVIQTTGDTDPCGFESVNGYCYIATGTAADGAEGGYSGGIQHWDGFYYTVGSVACTGNTTLTGTNTTWSTYVLPGDKVFYVNRGNGTWYGPYVVKSVGSNTAITLTASGQSTAAFTPADDADYIIVRMHNAGITPPSVVPTTSDQTASGGVTAGAHTYRIAFYDLRSEFGHYDTESDTSSYTQVTITADGTAVKLECYINTLPPEPTQNLFWRIYRTKAGAGTYYWLADVAVSSVIGSGWLTIYVDTTADASLSATTYPKGTNTYSHYVYSYRATNTALASTPPGAGDYSYQATLYNANTDTESDPSGLSATITLAAGHYAQVALDVTTADKQATHARFYRRAHDLSDTNYYYVGTAAWTAGTTSITFNDDSTPNDEATQAVSDDHDTAPDGVDRLRAFNGRLYAWGSGTYPQRLYFSTLGGGKYWPPYEYGVNDPVFTDASLGGFADMGHPGEKIVMAIADNGAYSSSGATGADLLVQTKTRAFTWWGIDWADHRRDEAWTEGACSNSGANCGGILAWMSRNGPVLKPTGAPLPDRSYMKLFPTLRYPFWEQVTAGSGSTDYFELSSGVYWRDFYVFTWCQTTSTVPNKMAMLHIPTGTYSEIGTSTYPCKAYSLCVWNGPGDNGELYYGDAEKGSVWRLFAKTGTKSYWTPSTTTGVECKYKSGLLVHGDKTDETWHMKHPGKLVLCFSKPTTSQTITASAYANGEETTADWNSSSLTISSSASGNRNYLNAGEPTTDGRSFILGWTGTLTEQVTFEGSTFDYSSHGLGL